MVSKAFLRDECVAEEVVTDSRGLGLDESWRQARDFTADAVVQLVEAGE